jgi:SAM-dependent methyltransferase
LHAATRTVPTPVAVTTDGEAWSFDDIKRYLMDMERPASERENHRLWVEGCLPRFVRTLQLVPQGGPGEQCVEIGAMPYTFTLLMKKFRRYALTLVDFEASGNREHCAEFRLPSFGEEHRFHSLLFDIEHEELPFADNSFNGALCCEVLEHLTADPIRMLATIHRILKPNGWLVLTTPNVANLQNILALLHGRNVYKPYEAVFGPTWRHNREYTAGEVVELLTTTGFIVDYVAVEQALAPGQQLPLSQRIINGVLRFWYRQQYGDQLYVAARRGPVFHRCYPAWLFEHAYMLDQPTRS